MFCPVASKRGRKESAEENEQTSKDKGQRSLKDFFALDADQDDKDKPEKKQTEKPSKGGTKPVPSKVTDAPKLACPVKRGKPKLKPTVAISDNTDDVMEFSSDRSESDTGEPKPKRAAPPRRAAAAGTKKYTCEISDQDSEQSDDDDDDDATQDSENDFAYVKPLKKRLAPVKTSEKQPPGGKGEAVKGVGERKDTKLAVVAAKKESKQVKVS